MKSSLLLIGVSTFLAAACGGTSSGTSGSSGSSTSGGSPASSASSSGGVSTSAGTSAGTSGANGTTGGVTGGATTGGSTTGPLAAGAPCTSNAACASDLCGVSGTGHCCTATCSADGACGASDCDATGACTYPSSSTPCGGAASCSDGLLTAAGACDGSGTCGATTPAACAGNFACASATACATTCASSSDCQTGFVCNNAACVPPAALGTCTENDDCTSGVCGLNGTGECCTTACANTADPACNPTACDATGACVFPAGTACGTNSCASGTETTNACDATGACTPSSLSCPGGFGCDAAGTGCLTSCAADPDCASSFFCVLDAGTCAAQQATGPCTENDACTTGICGLAGTGNCCAAACSTTDAVCGATGCDATSAACDYPDGGTLCGSVAESCSGSTQQNPSACDGTGSCNTAPGTTDCTPYICGTNACFATCTDNSSCGTGDFCDVANTTCCAPIQGSALAVDSTNGSDGACCGGVNNPCATLTQAMKLIDSAQAQNVTITATVAGGGGDWSPTAGETYPIVLGWGVELSAPGVYFNDVAGNNEIFDIANYSANDTVGYASIVGTAAGNVWIGMDSTGVQTEDSSAIQVEGGNTLYIANATANGNSAPSVLAVAGTTAITVVAGGSLVVGQDQSAATTGTVTIGGTGQQDGYNGIVCTSANSLGCTITDAALTGTSGLVIQNQDGVDIDAEDFASISLASAPTIGVAPTSVGFEQCPSKDDAEFSALTIPAAILLNGAVTMTFDNGTVSCISGDGFVLQDTANGSPSLTIDKSTIENTELGIYANAGTATVTGTAIQYNYNGVEQDADTTSSATGTINLSGGGNSVVCSSNIESQLGGTNPGISALNTTAQTLDASNTAWDTKTPDQFQCNAALNTCTCEVTACTTAAGTDGMDAVYEGATNDITTTGNTVSNLSCAPPPPPGCAGGPPCGPNMFCCVSEGMCIGQNLNCPG